MELKRQGGQSGKYMKVSTYYLCNNSRCLSVGENQVENHAQHLQVAATSE